MQIDDPQVTIAFNEWCRLNKTDDSGIGWTTRSMKSFAALLATKREAELNAIINRCFVAVQEMEVVTRRNQAKNGGQMIMIVDDRRESERRFEQGLAKLAAKESIQL